MSFEQEVQKTFINVVKIAENTIKLSFSLSTSSCIVVVSASISPKYLNAETKDRVNIVIDTLHN